MASSALTQQGKAVPEAVCKSKLKSRGSCRPQEVISKDKTPQSA